MQMWIQRQILWIHMGTDVVTGMDTHSVTTVEADADTCMDTDVTNT